MPKTVLLWRVALIVAVVAWVGWGIPQAVAQPARVPQTGQTECWDAVGNPINCAGTGQDGDIQAGVVFPAQRFRDNGNGTVRDNLTGLIWLQDASCDTLGPNGNGTGTWQQALDAANTLASGNCSLTDRSAAGDWRLPNVNELHSLLDVGNYNPAFPSGHPFSGVLTAFFWSSSSHVGFPFLTWTVDLEAGWTLAVIKDSPNSARIWPVRGGD